LPLFGLSPTVVIAVATVAGSLAYLAFALTHISPTVNLEHANHSSQVTIAEQPGLRNIELTANIVRIGYANNLSNFKINRDYIDPDNSCEYCTRVTFLSSKSQDASVAYKVNNTNLAGLRRAVFFAMGQDGGEELAFYALGKKIDESNNTQASTFFPGINFIHSMKTRLDNSWHRYEFDLKGDNLSNVFYPFGFTIPHGNSSGVHVIYIKGITFDDKPAKNLMNETAKQNSIKGSS
jgi:hypothetical protein